MPVHRRSTGGLPPRPGVGLPRHRSTSDAVWPPERGGRRTTHEHGRSRTQCPSADHCRRRVRRHARRRDRRNRSEAGSKPWWWTSTKRPNATSKSSTSRSSSASRERPGRRNGARKPSPRRPRRRRATSAYGCPSGYTKQTREPHREPPIRHTSERQGREASHGVNPPDDCLPSFAGAGLLPPGLQNLEYSGAAGATHGHLWSGRYDLRAIARLVQLDPDPGALDPVIGVQMLIVMKTPQGEPMTLSFAKQVAEGTLLPEAGWIGSQAASGITENPHDRRNRRWLAARSMQHPRGHSPRLPRDPPVWNGPARCGPDRGGTHARSRRCGGPRIRGSERGTNFRKGGDGQRRAKSTQHASSQACTDRATR